MTAAGFVDEHGPLRIGELIGRGGEGEVYALADGSMRALKVFHEPDAAREAKVRRMVGARLSEACPDVAFPTGLAFTAGGSFVGFTMPRATGGLPIHELYAPSTRRRHFPNADWRFLVRTGGNLARIFARIHALGVVVGDVNGSGVLVSPRAVATVIDADSFQLTSDHLCRVGVPEFTSPELQGRNLEGVVRTIDHDAFGLAVMLFHLLFAGRHPFAGVPLGRDVPLTDAIRQGQFAYSRIRNVRLAQPPRTLSLTDVPLGVRVLFERAFALRVGPRPRAHEWASELEALEGSLTACTRNDTHWRPTGASDCPWCRIERMDAAPVFGLARSERFGASPGRDDGVRADVRSALVRSRSLAAETAEPRIRPLKPRPTEQAREYRLRDQSEHLIAQLIAARPVKGRMANDRFTRPFLLARDDLAAALDDWRDRAGVWKVNRLSARLADDLARLDAITEGETLELSRKASVLRDACLRERLSRDSIARAAVPHVGPARLARLARSGIVTAADVTGGRLAPVAGLGGRAAVSLLLWRDGIAVRHLRTMPPQPLPRDIVEEVRSSWGRRMAKASELVRALAEDLDRAVKVVARHSRDRDPKVDEARAALAQAVADLEFLGLPIPRPGDVIPPSVPKGSFAKTKGKSKGGGPAKKKGAKCPLCGGPMVRRWARSGSSPSRYFLGCASYPGCSGSRPLRGATP